MTGDSASNAIEGLVIATGGLVDGGLRVGPNEVLTVDGSLRSLSELGSVSSLIGKMETRIVADSVTGIRGASKIICGTFTVTGGCSFCVVGLSTGGEVINCG